MLADALIAGRWRLPHSEVARLSRLQAGAWHLYGGAKDLVSLIKAGATAAGQFGPDHQRLMEYLASADRPLLVDTFEVTEDNYERWAEALERGVAAMGGQVLGAVPRTSAFEWQWAWGPPPQGRVRVQAGGRTVVISPEATVLIRPPEGRERGFAQRYFERIRKAQPLAAAKQAVQERLQRVWPRVLRHAMAGRDGAGPDWEEAQAAIRELKHLEQQEAAAHARRYRRGEVLTPVAWYEVDARANYRPNDAWAWGRLTATPEGVHYISHQLDKGGPRLVVSPDIAPWIQYSTIAPGDKYGQQ